MDDFSCPHCRTGYLEDGSCAACGWSITSSLHLRPLRLPLEPSPTAVGICWFALPLACVIANIFVPILTIGVDYDFGFMVTIAMAAAQFGLLTIVGALGPGRSALRLMLTFAIATVLLFTLMVGIAAAVGIAPAGRPLREAGGYFLVLPALLLAAQGPLWVFRAVTGKRIHPATESRRPGANPKTQYGVAQLLWATAMIAVCIALARGAFILWSPDRGQTLGPLWTRGATACAVAAIGSTFVMLPAAMLLMARSARGAAVLILVYAVMLTIALLAIAKAVVRPATLDGAAIFAFILLTTFGGILAGLAVIRSGGYTMHRE